MRLLEFLPLSLPTVLLVMAVGLANNTDDLGRLSQQLKTDPDFKVRLSAGLKLGRLGNPRAVPVLTDALGDSVAAIRAIAANALAALINRKVAADQRTRALTTLKRMSQHDDDPRARHAAGKAVAALEFVELAARPRSTRGSIFVNVEPISDPSHQLDAETLAKMTDNGRDALLAADASLIVEWPGGAAPTLQMLKKAKAKGAVTVISTLTELSVTPKGKRAQIECKLNLIVATYPQRAARVFIDGKARLETANNPVSVGNAKSRCGTNIVKHLMGKRLIPDLSSVTQ